MSLSIPAFASTIRVFAVDVLVPLVANTFLITVSSKRGVLRCCGTASALDAYIGAVECTEVLFATKVNDCRDLIYG